MKAVPYSQAVAVARNVNAYTIHNVLKVMSENGCGAQARQDVIAAILDGYEYFEPRFWECVLEVEEATEQVATVASVA